MSMRQHTIEMGNDDPYRGEDIRSDQAEGDEPPARGFQVSQLPRCRHPHLEEEEAEDTLEQRDEEVVIGPRDFRALQAADVADHDAAEEQTKAGVQEDFME